MELRPLPIYWLIKYFIIILIAFALSISSVHIDDEYFLYGVFALLCIVILLLIYTYVDMLFCTTWEITDEKIQIKQGVFYRKIDYIELYRVVDYAESQTLLQIIFKNKTVTVESGDKSHPVFLFYGIDKNENIIEYLRSRVEAQKKKIGVYEVTNR